MLTTTVRQNGQITLPPQLQQEYGLQIGDSISFLKGQDGWILVKEVIETPEPDPIALLDQLGDALRADGVTLEQFIEDGHEIRRQLVKEMYGLTD